MNKLHGNTVETLHDIPGWTGENERTFVAVKPDGVQRRLVGEIVRRFERRGFKLVGLKLVQVRLVNDAETVSPVTQMPDEDRLSKRRT